MPTRMCFACRVLPSPVFFPNLWSLATLKKLITEMRIWYSYAYIMPTQVRAVWQAKCTLIRKTWFCENKQKQQQPGFAPINQIFLSKTRLFSSKKVNS